MPAKQPQKSIEGHTTKASNVTYPACGRPQGSISELYKGAAARREKPRGVLTEETHFLLVASILPPDKPPFSRGNRVSTADCRSGPQTGYGGGGCRFAFIGLWKHRLCRVRQRWRIRYTALHKRRLICVSQRGTRRHGGRQRTWGHRSRNGLDARLWQAWASVHLRPAGRGGCTASIMCLRFHNGRKDHQTNS